MTDEFHWWREALKGNYGDISESQPQPGYFKMRDGRDGPWRPVAIWTVNGELIARVGPDRRDAMEIWTHCAKNPVAKLDAKHAFEHGTWPSDVPQSNSANLTIQEEIADAVEQALSWLKSTPIANKATSDMAANWRARLLDLGKQADRQRDAEKRPHDDASKAVQAKWKPSIESAADAANAIRDQLTPYLNAEKARLQREAEAKARAENERLRREHEAEVARLTKARELAASSMPDAPLPEIDVPPPQVVEVETVKVQAGGQRGRKAGLRTVTRFVVVDYAATLAAVKDHPEVRAAVEKVAAAQSRTGIAVPGVEAVHEQVAA